MRAVLIHRAPDDNGFDRQGPVGLGYRGLSIIDVAGGKQPMVSEGGYMTVLKTYDSHSGLEFLGHEMRRHAA